MYVPGKPEREFVKVTVPVLVYRPVAVAVPEARQVIPTLLPNVVDGHVMVPTGLLSVTTIFESVAGKGFMNTYDHVIGDPLRMGPRLGVGGLPSPLVYLKNGAEHMLQECPKLSSLGTSQQVASHFVQQLAASAGESQFQGV